MIHRAPIFTRDTVRFMTYTSAQTTLFDMASISGGEVVRE